MVVTRIQAIALHSHISELSSDRLPYSCLAATVSLEFPYASAHVRIRDKEPGHEPVSWLPRSHRGAVPLAARF
jgi:hypothetical protein